MSRIAWTKLPVIALQTICVTAAIITIDTTTLPTNEREPLTNVSVTLFNSSQPITQLPSPDINITTISQNLTAGPNTASWTDFITTGIRLTQTAFPGTSPTIIKTYSCDDHDYPHWYFLDCYTITFSGPSATSSASIAGRWDQLNAHPPFWDEPVHSPGSRRGEKPTVPWPPFVGLEAAEAWARGTGHTLGYHAVELEGVVGSRGSFFYKFFSEQGRPWHVSFHDGGVSRMMSVS